MSDKGSRRNALRAIAATMWILVVGSPAALARDGSAADTLAQLGCEIRTMDLWDHLEDVEERPPSAIFIEALDEVDAARAALIRVRRVDVLSQLPALVGVSVPALTRVDASDPFDDIVLYPYVPAELYLRIRRAEWRRSEFVGEERLKIGTLCVDLAAHDVTVDGRVVDLTPQEFSLLRFFCERRGRVFSRDQLLKSVWGVDYYGSSRTVDIHVRRLRQKLGPAVEGLETVRGVGYRMRQVQ